MSRSTVSFIFFLGFLVIVLGYNYFARPFDGFFAPEKMVVDQNNSEPELTPELLILSHLSTREKILQMLAVPVTVTTPSSPSGTLTWATEHQAGFVTLFGERISTESALLVSNQLAQSDDQSQSNGDQLLPIFIAVDHEGGSVQRLSGAGFTRLPPWQELCQLDEDKRTIVLTKSASELAAVGVDIVFAPVVDVASKSAVLGNRVCADDSETVVNASYQFATIFTQQELLPVYKHFPGIGNTHRDLHTQFDQVAVTSEEALIYRSLLTLQPQAGVMVAHVGVENQYPNVPCSLSSSCVSELHTTFPEVLIFSDALDMKAAAYNHDGNDKELTQISVEAVQAGNQVLVYGKGVTPAELEAIISSVEESTKTDQNILVKIDEAVAAIIRYKLKLNHE